MPLVQEVRRRVVDVQQHGVEAPVGGLGIEGRLPFLRTRQREEIAVDEAAAGIRHQPGAQRHQATLMPLDDRLQVVDDDQGAHGIQFQRRAGGVAQPQTADHHVQPGFSGEVPRRRRQPEPRQRLLHLGEEAAHQVGVAEDDLVHLEVVEGQDAAAAEDQLAERGLAVVEFLEAGRRMHAGF